ncbi:MAG: TonB-dependent receptor [Bacteroidota bacterium]|jgi:iron complex outermembrane receptor protein
MKLRPRFLGVLAAILVNSVSGQQVSRNDKDTLYYLSPVIITATQAKERETPATFSSFDRQQIVERTTVQDVPAVLSELPSIITYSENGNDIGYTHLNMRGFDERRVAVMVNGVPQNDPEDHIVYWIDMPDLLAYTQNVQVMRGAGSDFYGPPAIGGSINFTTMPLSLKPGVVLSSDAGFQEYGDEKRTILNTHKYGLALNSGLVDGKYMLFGNFSAASSSGYRQHSWTDVNSYYIGAERLDESMTTRIDIYGGPLHDGLAYNGIPRFYNNDFALRRINYNYFGLNAAGDSVQYPTLRRPEENESFSQPHYELLNEWRISPAVKLYNTFFYIEGNGYFDYDGSWIPYPDPQTGKPTPAMLYFMRYVGYDSTFGSTTVPDFLIRAFVGNKQWGWLPRFDIDHGSGTLTVGGELRIHRSLHWGSIPYASVYPQNYEPDFHFYQFNGEKDMASLYGHEILHASDRMTLMVDVQFVYDRYGLDNEKFLGTSFSVPYFFVNPHVGLNQNFTDQLNGYVSVSLTSREPSLPNLYQGEEAYYGATPSFDTMTAGGKSVLDFSKPLARSERLLDVEMGSHLTSSAGKFSANLYWMEFNDELIDNGQLDVFGVPVTGNADRTRHIGLELTAQTAVSKMFDLGGTMTVSRNRLIRYTAYDDSSRPVSLDGNRISGFPEFLANARFGYHEGPFTASLHGRYVGPFYTDNTSNEQRKVDAYTVFDLDASYGPYILTPGVSVAIHGKVINLFNRLYLAGGQGIEFFPAAERSYLVGLTVGL